MGWGGRVVGSRNPAIGGICLRLKCDLKDETVKKLKVDAEDIAIIMDKQDRFESSYYLDTETGETVVIPDEVMTALEDEEFREDLPEWEVKLLPQAKEISEGISRYVEIPARDSHEAYHDMEYFAGNLRNSALRAKLESAIHGRGSFRRFKDALREYPEMEKEWFKFKAARDKEEVKDWLESIGIEIEIEE